jgi:hypothetical protein
MGQTLLIKMSPSSLGTLQSCPYKYYLKYIKGIDVVEPSENLRIGSVWHKCLEILAMSEVEGAPNRIEAVTDYLNDLYEDKPDFKTEEEWQLEKIKMLYAAVAYDWYYTNDRLTPVLTEYAAELPLIDTDTGRAVRGVKVKAIIDNASIRTGRCLIVEHKSTSESIEPDSRYWGKLAMDTQTRLYPYVMRLIQTMPSMKKVLGEQPIFTVLYDVYKKPTTKPTMLTQGESKEFVETGEYCGVKFVVTQPENGVFVNGVAVEFKPGKKEGTFAIKETAEMYGARLIQDMYANPEKYFARKEITRTDGDLSDIAKEFVTHSQILRFRMKNNCWEKNGKQCENMYKCEFTDICYNRVNVEEGQLPDKYYFKTGESNGSNETTTEGC